MKPTTILVNEHRIIEQVFDCLERMMERCAAEGRLKEASAREAVGFFRAFAECARLAKEEAHLFPMMQANGFSAGCSPVVVMLREHELGRLYVQGMDAAMEPAAAGDSESLKWFVQHGRSYLTLIREHIRNEDNCLFPAAGHRLTEKDQEQLLAAFEKVEAEETGQGTHEASLRIANELAHRFGVPRTTAGQPGRDLGGGCGHSVIERRRGFPLPVGAVQLPTKRL